MLTRRVLDLFARMLVIIALMTGGVAASATSAAGSDCMAMTRMADDTGPQNAPETKTTCPFAAICAASSVFLETASVDGTAPQHAGLRAAFPFADIFGDGLSPPPRGKPPRS